MCSVRALIAIPFIVLIETDYGKVLLVDRYIIDVCSIFTKKWCILKEQSAKDSTFMFVLRAVVHVKYSSPV